MAGVQFPAHITAAHEQSDDSDYATDPSEYSTESLNSSILEYRYENGRRYHAYKEGKYSLPNDEAEQDRLDIVHHIYLILLDDRLHLAPIDPKPQRILDVGTGTGIWAIDTGERYPSARVIGTDLSPIQPSWVPPNVEFQIDDAESEWTFEKNSFDLIHIRDLGGAIASWDKLLTEAYKHCKPGAWIDLSEYEVDIFSDDGSLPDHFELKQFYKLVNEAAAKTGRTYGISTKLKPLLEKVGFTNVHHQPAKVPVGPWAADRKQKEVGAYVLLTAETGFEAYGIKLFTDVLGMSLDETKRIIRETLKQAKDRKIHSYGICHFYYAQKPLEE